MNDTTEANTNTALAVISEPEAPVAASLTPAQAKIDAVAHLTMKAYERAATLQLTAEESAALQADFPNEAFKTGAAGKENLLYLEHAYIRDRFNQVFGPGQWAIVPRNRWAEDFSTAKGIPASRVYVEAMLLVRGCFVAEAVGDMVYYKNNDSQNYGDAVEGAKTASFRRCAKELGVGLQAWKKDWCAQWMKERAGGSQTHRMPTPPPSPAPAPKVAPKPVSAPAGAISVENWLERCREKLLKLLQPNLAAAWVHAVRAGWIMDNERLEGARAETMFPGIDYSVKTDDPAMMSANVAIARKLHKEIMESVQAIADGEPDGEMQAKFASVYVKDEKPIEVPRDSDAGQQEEDSPPPDTSDCESVRDKIDFVTCKHGESQRGPWTRYGIKCKDDWYNTFDKTLGKKCESLKGQTVTLFYREGEKGNDLVAVE